ncbi:MAG: flavin reductase family protein [Oscillospiraceae bacterium]|jgi:flavin reductase (DIM6/NTAB) family NADH-FMN oxidoreductase RutF|nr:flavin reductase family protein [Oscillospiraceae bacterium]
MKRKINLWEYAETILEHLQRGVLLTSKAGEQVNTMTISWGTLGIEWSKPIFTVFVRENRFTRQLLEQNPEFTINIPVGGCDPKILGICGTKTGRDTDKFHIAGLTQEEPEVVSVPAIRELPLTLECRIVYKQPQDPQAITEENRAAFYPQDVDASFPGANRDYHTAYYGEIVAAYLIEE